MDVLDSRMSLFVRIDVGFWQHRKTLRLRALIGDAALWIPPRLWCYAAQNQPDGDFTEYLPEEIAMLIGYSGNAVSMLEALQQAKFFDGMLIHDWKEHNGYHETFAVRAKTAANARWEKDRKRKEKRGQEKRGEEASNASSIKTLSKAKGTIEELRSFCVEIGLPETDGDASFFKWEGNGWKNGQATIKDWRQTIRAWQTNGYMPSQKIRAGGNGNGKPRQTEAQRDQERTGLPPQEFNLKRL